MDTTVPYGVIRGHIYLPMEVPVNVCSELNLNIGIYVETLVYNLALYSTNVFGCRFAIKNVTQGQSIDLDKFVERFKFYIKRVIQFKISISYT